MSKTRNPNPNPDQAEEHVQARVLQDCEYGQSNDLVDLPETVANPDQAEEHVQARVLQDCEYGQSNDLVDLPETVAKAAEKAGLVDTEKAAVEYAASLSQNQ